MSSLLGRFSSKVTISVSLCASCCISTGTICCSLNDTTAYYEGLDWLAEVLTGAGSKGEKKKRKKTPSSTLSALQPDENSLKEYSGKRSLLWKQLRCCC